MAEEKKVEKKEIYEVVNVPVQHEQMIMDTRTEELYSIQTSLGLILNKLEKIEKALQ